MVGGGTEGVTEFSATSTPQYGFRGTMLDLSRHFFGAPEIKAVIDLASQYNLNQLHLHLSDNQGWRIEIEGRPELVKLAAENDVDGGKGGYLCLVDYDEIQDYAELYGMTLVPEIDLPGHTNALQVAYPELTPDGIPRKPYAGVGVGFSYVHLSSPKTWEVLENIVASLAKHAYLDLKPVEDFPLGLPWAGLVNLETAFNWDPAQAIPVPGPTSPGTNHVQVSERRYVIGVPTL